MSFWQESTRFVNAFQSFGTSAHSMRRHLLAIRWPDGAERNMQIAIQAVIDIGNHVVAALDLGTPKDYKDIFQLLARNNLISEPLSRKLISMTGLRNVLVHDYLEVDLRLIHRIISSELGDFEEFIAAALKLL